MSYWKFSVLFVALFALSSGLEQNKPGSQADKLEALKLIRKLLGETPLTGNAKTQRAAKTAPRTSNKRQYDDGSYSGGDPYNPQGTYGTTGGEYNDGDTHDMGYEHDGSYYGHGGGDNQMEIHGSFYGQGNMMDNGHDDNYDVGRLCGELTMFANEWSGYDGTQHDGDMGGEYPAKRQSGDVLAYALDRLLWILTDFSCGRLGHYGEPHPPPTYHEGDEYYGSEGIKKRGLFAKLRQKLGNK